MNLIELLQLRLVDSFSGNSIVSLYHIPLWIQGVIGGAFLGTSILVHERSHYNVLRSYGIKNDIQTEKHWYGINYKIEWEKNLTRSQHADVYLVGILMGLTILLGLPWFNFELFLVVTVFYMIGCKHDIKALWRL